MAKVNNFDVLKVMGERNMDVRLAPLNNIIRMNYNHKRGTELTIGVEGDVLNAIHQGRLVGGLILADKAQFDRLKEEMEETLPEEPRDA